MQRAVCSACGHIHYENPRVVVGCIAAWNDRILLCRRGIEPRYGFWTLPAGFMENGESCAEGAAREAREEACAHLDAMHPFALISIPPIGQVHVFFRANLIGGNCAIGEETLEVGLFGEEEIPWADLAFQSVRFCLESYLADRRRGSFGFHTTDLRPAPP